MRVLLVSQFFPPETGGPPNRLASIARELKREGHEVAVVTAKPNHPEGVIWEEHRGAPFEERQWEGIPVVRTWVYARPSKTFASRVLNYTSFMLMAVLGSTRIRGTFDVVLASSPPLFVGLAGWAVARLKGARFVFDVRDLWPDVAAALGALSEGVALQGARQMERFIYRRANAVSAVTESFCQHIRTYARPGTSVRRVMNGTVPEIFAQDEKRTALRRKLKLDNDFAVAYVGNMGPAQGLFHVLEAAKRLAEEPGVRFLFVGSGAVKDELKTEARRRGLANVQFVSRVPLPEAAAHMAAADALLVPLARHPIYRQFIPSKLFDSMASGRPVLLSVDGEARAILEKADAGLYYPAEDAAALAERVRRLKARPAEGKEMGARGRSFAREACTRQGQARRMAKLLSEVAAM